MYQLSSGLSVGGENSVVSSVCRMAPISRLSNGRAVSIRRPAERQWHPAETDAVPHRFRLDIRFPPPPPSRVAGRAACRVGFVRASESCLYDIGPRGAAGMIAALVWYRPWQDWGKSHV